MTNYEKKNALTRSGKKSGGKNLVPIKDLHPKADKNKLVPIQNLEKSKVDTSKLVPIKSVEKKSNNLVPIKDVEKKSTSSVKKKTATPRATSGSSASANSKLGVKNAKKKY